MRYEDYSMIDKKIDDYLGTRNLRPGPPARLIYFCSYLIKIINK